MPGGTKLYLIVILGLATLAQARPLSVCQRRALAELLVDWQARQTPAATLAPDQATLLKDYFVRYLQQKLLLKPSREFRACSFEERCWTFEGDAGEKSLRVKWVEGLESPRITVAGTSRTLQIPLGYTYAQMKAQGPALLNQWTMGHSVHPQMHAPTSPLRNLRADAEASLAELLERYGRGVASGQLAPLENFYAIQTRDLRPMFSGAAEASGDRILPGHYAALAGRLEPLLRRHARGLLVTADPAEAEALAGVFETSMPDRAFAVLHAQLPRVRREAVEARVRGGEPMFVITVRGLDDKVSARAMSLYVELNRFVDPRRFVYRLGSLSHLFAGKEGVEVAALFDWFEQRPLADHLAILNRLAEVLPKRPLQAFNRRPLDGESLAPLSREDQRQRLRDLRRTVLLGTDPAS